MVKKSPQSALEKFISYRYAFLFTSIIILFLIMPLFKSQRSLVMTLFFLLTMISVIWTLNLRRGTFWFCLGLGGLASLLTILNNYFFTTDFNFNVQLLTLTAYIAFFAISIVVFLEKIFAEKAVTSDTIKGGISVYFLMGLLWTFLYQMVLLFDPQAIMIPYGPEHIPPLIYFSFTTLTTLGYGDVTPVSMIARNLTILESTFGQIYLAVLVARLVGLHLRKK